MHKRRKYRNYAQHAKLLTSIMTVLRSRLLVKFLKHKLLLNGMRTLLESSVVSCGLNQTLQVVHLITTQIIGALVNATNINYVSLQNSR